MTTLRYAAVAVLTVLVSISLAADQKAAPAKENAGLPLLFHEDFTAGPDALKRFTPTDPKAWKIAEDEVGGAKRNVLSLFQKANVKTPVRSPFGQCWVNDLKVSSFVMEVKLRSTVKDYNHRDLCLFFGGVDDSHLFYVHLGKVADPHCNNIFLVDGKDRVAVGTKTSKGTDWDDAYHTVKLTRDDAGSITVYWDGAVVMTSDNKALPVGKVGVGSFDDLGNFAEMTVWGKKAD
jgi:hypothetical protein